ncbi:MAG: chondroitinase family polysaccharide lyase [Armatimonadota bacterium]|jgi:chondroitin-sulfate-ABC endolyase/exolyase
MRRPLHVLSILTALLAVMCPPLSHVAGAESFEAQRIPDGWAVTGEGAIELSSERFKDGGQSLLWRWEAGDALVFSDAEALAEAGGFTAWIHSAEAMDGRLRVRFGAAGEVETGEVPLAFDYPLHFSGWRFCVVNFRDDIPVEGYVGAGAVEVMRIEAPEQGAGELHIDLVEFPAAALWARGADRQLPFLNPRRDHDWFLRFDDAALAATPDRPATAEEREALELIEARYRAWLTGEGIDWSDPLIADRAAALVERAQEAAERLGELIEQPLVTQAQFREFFEPMGLLAVAWHADAPGNPLRGDEAVRDLIVAAFNHLHEQGWAEGSLFGDARVFRLMTGGYSAAVFLMQDVLREAGIRDREMAAARWYSCVGRVFEETDNVGMNADVIRGRFLLALAWVLSLDDVDERAYWMRNLSPWMSRSLRLAPKWADTIKPDFTGFHHSMIVGGSYVINAVQAAAASHHLLSDTTFALTDEATENLRGKLLASRFYANKYDLPTTLALRWPFMTESIFLLMPAYAYMALTDDTPDQRMMRAFQRIWDPSVPEIAEKSLRQGQVGFTFMGTLGAAAAVAEAAARDVAAEAAPTGFRFFPYGALAVHRRDDWMVSTKGWSRYIFNYEQQQYQPGRSGRNIHGRYTSHGTTQAYSAGDPVSPEASGLTQDGWDWNRWPGTTAVYRPWDELYARYPYGRQTNDETFVGAVEHEGRNGLFSMVLSDPHHDPGFRALKTYMYVDDRVISIGTHITNDQPERAVETTVFQLSLTDEAQPIFLNSIEPVTAFPFAWEGGGDGPVWLIDQVGNGYLVPDPRDLRVARQRQLTPPPYVPEPSTEGDFAVAWFDHGPAPEAAGYEYLTVIRATPERMAALVSEPGYEVLSRNEQAHIIRDLQTGITGYALFEAGAVPAGEHVLSVDTPSLVMTQMREDGLVISVCDPDLGWTEEVEHSPVKLVRVTVAGAWQAEGRAGVSAVIDGDRTIVEFSCGDGRTRESVLKPAAQ